MKTKIFTCKVINSELQAAEYVSNEFLGQLCKQGFADEKAGQETVSI